MAVDNELNALRQHRSPQNIINLIKLKFNDKKVASVLSSI